MKSEETAYDDKHCQTTILNNDSQSEKIRRENNYYLQQLSKIFKSRAKNLFSYSPDEEEYVITKINDLSIKIIAMDDFTEDDKNKAKDFINPDAYPINSFDTFEIRPELISMANKKNTTEPTRSEIRIEYQSTKRAKNILLKRIERSTSKEYYEKILEQHNKHLLQLEEEYPECCI